MSNANQSDAKNRPLSKRAVIVFVICAGLVAITWAVFGQTLQFQFVNYDDDSYVYENSAVINGLTATAVVSAFSHSDLYLWTPLTRMSHVLDAQIYKLNPRGHHFTNVILHTVNVLLLFGVLWRMSGMLWRSAFVAALFAIHPLHVESVAWVSERKDVLSGLFFTLTLWTYERYSRWPPHFLRYSCVVIFFVLGLLSKPMLVTLPFILLLLDYWPLRRLPLQKASNSSLNRFVTDRVIVEKLPLLVLSIVSVYLVVFDPFSWNDSRLSHLAFPLSSRFSNALVSYAIYIWEAVYPVDLAVRYPFPTDGIPWWQTVSSLLLIVSITIWSYSCRHRQPYNLVGWLWYLGMLVPVIGIFQLGGEARSDRYTYLSQIGLYLMVTWTVASVSTSWRWRRPILSVGSGVIIVTLIWFARIQTSYWRNSEELWNHTLAVTKDNTLAHNNLGKAQMDNGHTAEALKHFEKAVQLQPTDAVALSNLGVGLALMGRPEMAIQYSKDALHRSPGSPIAENNFCFVLNRAGYRAEAIIHGTAALRLKPDWAEAHTNLGSAWSIQGNPEQALYHFREAVRLKPSSTAALNNLAWALATGNEEKYRNASEALSLARQAAELSHNADPTVLDTLAAALAENHQFADAVETATRARELAILGGLPVPADRISSHLEFYRRGLPYHQ
jgi:protein O-mannosyl-transferase